VPIRLAAVAVTMVLTMLALLLPMAEPASAVDRRTPAKIRDRIEYLINRDRARAGLPKLRVHANTQYYARSHSRQMARRGRLWHDSNLRNEIPRGARAWGENVGRTSASDAAARSHYLFMSSSAHRANIMRRGWTHMGIGVAKRNGRTYITHRFWHR
jgi:uncharacterized protein YkwD